jgi:hypothetical protein
LIWDFNFNKFSNEKMEIGSTIIMSKFKIVSSIDGSIPWSITPQITKAQEALVRMFDSLSDNSAAKLYIPPLL